MNASVKTLLISIFLFLLSTHLMAQSSVDIDSDDNGLIEIHNLQMLNAIRYQLDGSGYKASTDANKITTGCAVGGCRGYELVRDLDFMDDASYASSSTLWTVADYEDRADTGWQPIGTENDAFNAIFNGNNHTLFNLMINRPDTDYIGLFGLIQSGASIANLALSNVNVSGNKTVGGLAGANNGRITGSYVTGFVTGESDEPSLINIPGTGALVGHNGNNGSISYSYAVATVIGKGRATGGLVGLNNRHITNSYAVGSVTGYDDVGGLVGVNQIRIENCYAMSTVLGVYDVGGLVGNNRSEVTNSYATSTAMGHSIGGLVARDLLSSTRDSYWDAQTSGIYTGENGTSKTTTELQSPTTATDIYSSWSTADWDFGSSSQYPILKNADGGLLSPALRYGLSQLRLTEGYLSPDFVGAVANYAAWVVSSTSTIQLIPTAVDSNARIRIAKGEMDGQEIASGDISDRITLNESALTTLTITVLSGSNSIEYKLNINHYYFAGDVDKDDDGLIEIDTIEGLNAIRYQPDGIGYREGRIAPEIRAGCPAEACMGYELTKDLDFLDEASYRSTAKQVLWTVDDYEDSEDLGWEVIAFLNATLEANKHTISNLMINSGATDVVGLFGTAAKSSAIVNLGLLDVHVRGKRTVGSLVAHNNGRLANSYAVGSVSATSGVTGGLAGENSGDITNSYMTGSISAVSNWTGGLAGYNLGDIRNSYASGSVSSVGDQIGGLVGRNSGDIMNSYASETVVGRGEVGGLVGRNEGGITNSYASGSVSATARVGGLVAVNVGGGRATSSYWDTQTSKIATSSGGVGKTTSELQSPITAAGIYSDWNTAAWDFGTPLYYPVLRYVAGTDTDNPACGGSDRPTCADLLPNQRPSFLEDLVVLNGRLSPQFSPNIVDYNVAVNFDATEFELHATATGASLRIYSDVSAMEVISTETASIVLPPRLIDNVMLNIEVLEGTQMLTSYRLLVSYESDKQEPKLSTPTLVVDGDASQTVDEGGTVTLRATVDSRFHCDSELSCGWRYLDSTSQLLEFAEMELSDDLLQLSFPVATDYVEAAEKSRSLVVVFLMRDRRGIIRAETTLTVVKQNNGSINGENVGPPILIGRTLNIPEIDLAEDPDGVNENPTFSYQWQSLNELGAWEDIADASSATYLAQDTADFIPHRALINYIDGQGYDDTIILLPQIVGFDVDKNDIDVDNDGLIEIRNLEMLDAIRYQPDGSGYRASAEADKIVAGCAAGGCIGYELIRDLDFMDDASYLSTSNRAMWMVSDYENSEEAGWRPIGTLANRFNTIFEGNKHTLSNLMINRPDISYVGLFGYMESSATIVNLALLNIHISGNRSVGALVGRNQGGHIINSYATGTIQGNLYVGGLVGENQDQGRITNSYAMGTVIGGNYTGALVGQNQGHIMNSYATASAAGNDNIGGLVGQNQGHITNSYATASVTGNDSIGGLVAQNQGHIRNSYATGSVAGNENIGGLVAQNQGHITNSYAIGSVAGNENIGGLVAQNEGSIADSYWDAQTSGIYIGGNGTSKTTIELQSPTTATGIYGNWSTIDWSFGNSAHYPILKYAVGSETSDPACDLPEQAACGDLLPDQLSLLDGLVVSNGILSPQFHPQQLTYDVAINFTVSQLVLQTTATDASLRIYDDASAMEVLSTETASVMLPLRLIGDTAIRIEVTQGARMATAYRLSVSYDSDDSVPKPTAPIITSNVDTQAIDEGSAVALRATVAEEYHCGSDLRCEWYYPDAVSKLSATLSNDSLQLSFTIPTDYIAATQASRQLDVGFALLNQGGIAVTERPLVILKQDNGAIGKESINPPTLIARTLSTPNIDLERDPDGVNEEPDLRYQWQRTLDLTEPDNWEDIEGATRPTYKLEDMQEDMQFTAYRVLISYTDGQNYRVEIPSPIVEDPTVKKDIDLKVRIRVFLETPL